MAQANNGSYYLAINTKTSYTLQTKVRVINKDSGYSLLHLGFKVKAKIYGCNSITCGNNCYRVVVDYRYTTAYKHAKVFDPDHPDNTKKMVNQTSHYNNTLIVDEENMKYSIYTSNNTIDLLDHFPFHFVPNDNCTAADHLTADPSYVQYAGVCSDHGKTRATGDTWNL
jgi:hypothetical protein